MSFSLTGSLIAFFYFNVFGKRYKIFLGDAGSLIVGMTIAIIMIRFIEYQTVAPNRVSVQTAPAIAFGLLIIPLFDTLRVFILRISQGRSPFSADRQHIHHLLLDLGFSHLKTTLMILSFNLLIIFISLGLKHISNLQLISLQLGLATGFSFFMEFLLKIKRKKVSHRIRFIGREVELFARKASHSQV
jgi:UDP-N-acetylmuramyl pentapeptide phosphotransferase/UDP-N-acetylglucosamine-1-phosphate transferase